MGAGRSAAIDFRTADAMSGVFGLVRFDAEASAEDLERQMRALARRGPDGARYWRGGAAGLGALRLVATQEDRFDAQPLVDADTGLVCVADARIDNREDIAAELGLDAQALSRMPDSTLIFAAFQRWGDACAERLLGDFLFAVWDPARRRLTLARDHMGQRYVFHHLGETLFAFASEPRGLWALADTPRELDEARLLQALRQELPSDSGETQFTGIRAVPGGSVLTLDVNARAVTVRRYWEPHADPAHLGRDDAYYAETYRKVLAEAVACRLRRAVAPGAVLLSGGFDTSAICALAAPAIAPQGRKLIGVSSVMAEGYDGPIADPRKWVEACRSHMPHLDVRYVICSSLDLLDGMERAFALRDMRHGADRPIVDALLKAAADAGARLAMDGLGGDYTLNPRGWGAIARLLRKGEWRRFRDELHATRRRRGESVKQALVRHVLIPLLPTMLFRRFIRLRNGLGWSDVGAPLAAGARAPGRQRWKRPNLIEGNAAKLRTLQMQQNAPSRAHALAAASYGLDFTQPFHDRRVVEFGLAIPEDLHYRNGRERHLALQALGDLYPPLLRERPEGNDRMNPDFLATTARAAPRMLEEIARMEASGRLSHLFDFPRMRAMLTRDRGKRRALDWGGDATTAAQAFIAARYVEWFRRDNQ
jgi:asparagine synthase (glutamine-hydrolysing)